MGIKEIFSDGLNWRCVNNTVKSKTINGSLLHTLQSTKKIKRRTRALNRKLKRRTAQKNYRWYVKIKTSILRNITDNEDTDDDVKPYTIGIEPNEDNSALALQSSHLSRETSIDFSSSDSANDTDRSRKQNNRKRKSNTIASHSSAPLAKRKYQKNKDAPQSVSIDHDRTQEKSLTTVKRNLTSSLENSKNNSGIIGERTKIDSRHDHEFQSFTEHQDSAQFDKVLVNNDAEDNGKRITRSTSSNSGKQEEKRKDLSITSCNSDFVNDADCTNMYRKEKNKTEKDKTPGSKSSARLADRNLQESPNVIRGDHDRMQEKSLKNVKRNLTSLLEDSKNDNGITSESIDIDTKESREFRQNAVLQDSVQFENFHNNKTTCGNTGLVSEKMSVSSDAESSDKPIKSEEGKEEEEVLKEDDGKIEEGKEEEEVLKEDDGKIKEEKDREEVNETEKEIGREEVNEDENEIGKEEEEEDDKYEDEEEQEKGEEESVGATTFEEEYQQRTMSKDSPMKKSQPVITSTEIVKAKYTIVRDDGETSDPEDASHIECPILETSRSPRESTSSNDQEANRSRKPSIESKRVAQPKGINLVSASSSDSEDSKKNKDQFDANNQADSNRNDEAEESARPSCSQIISDPSNADESIARPDDTNPDTVMGKSIVSQIREQENFCSSTPLRKITETPTKKAENDTSNVKKSRSVRVIANDALENREFFENVSGIDNFTTTRVEEEENEQLRGNDLRPIELCEYVDREGLVATEVLSTLTAKDFKEFAQENSDEEIWLMEIPKSIITDGDELCGKTMAFETGKMTINGTTYRTKCRDEKSVTCILRSRKKKSRFKTVNVEAGGCIVVRQEFSDKPTLLPPAQSACEFRSTVPFPKNLKPRNPLLGLDQPNDTDHLDHGSTEEDTSEILQAKKKRKKKKSKDFES